MKGSLVPRPLFSVFIKTEKSGLGTRLGERGAYLWYLSIVHVRKIPMQLVNSDCTIRILLIDNVSINELLCFSFNTFRRSSN